jgi:hypothetical protein
MFPGSQGDDEVFGNSAGQRHDTVSRPYAEPVKDRIEVIGERIELAVGENLSLSHAADPAQGDMVPASTQGVALERTEAASPPGLFGLAVFRSASRRLPGRETARCSPMLFRFIRQL